MLRADQLAMEVLTMLGLKIKSEIEIKIEINI
jgi:hypothetical protein